MAAKEIRKIKSHKIMIVDDEADIVSTLKTGLEKEGFIVTAFTDPREAIARFKPGDYDLLLLDIRMPGMTGFDLYRQIRKIDTKVKVCFITAFEIYFDEFRRVFPKLSVSCFVRKPVTLKELARIVNKELAREPLQEDEPAPRGFRNKESR